ncbi:HD domain-containing protein [Falsiroseomonas sp. E2-1-a20]|uniref:HD domain-containing protein n=1 Tax=Falsiroseomonas sp. E2-1-a20 TaxID=3239300 RepID=UPI003F37DC62
MTDGLATRPELRAEHLPLLRELGDLKRVRSAAREGSIAERLFASAWAHLAGGGDAGQGWRGAVSAALAATRMGDLDAAALAAVGVQPGAARAIHARAVDDAARAIDAEMRAALQEAAALRTGVVPPFVASLARQPRAGVTCPGRPRLLLEPPENHAEHCLMVAVYGVLLCPAYNADPATVYVAGLAHHLHNALLPDSGFVGEELLGDQLETAFRHATEAALAQLPAPVMEIVRQARRIVPDATTPEGRAFHAADTLDRVLQVEQHLRAGQMTLRFVLEEMELVHAGPVKPFQDRVLRDVGLLA